MSSAPTRVLRAASYLGFVFLFGGCVKVEHTIFLKADGTGQIVEKVWVADWVIQAAKSDPALASFPDLLQEEHVRQRLPAYGTVTLRSHEVTNRGCHGMEARTVLEFSDINAVSLPAVVSANGRISFALGEKQTSSGTTFTGWHHSVTRPLRISQTSAASPKDTLTPSEKERWEKLLPALQTMFKGLQLSARLEISEPNGGRSRHSLYTLTDKDLTGDAMIELLVSGRLPPSARLWKDSYTVSVNMSSDGEDATSGQ